MIAALLVSAFAAQPAEVGQPAPDFTLAATDGTEVTLSSLAGKTVVLEWFNPGCPYVKYAHGEGPLTDLAAKTEKADLVWLAINSGAPGKQGHGLELNKSAAAEWKMNHRVLVDESGAVGKQYGAVTTPHMYVIGPEGNLRYAGALDNAPFGKHEGEYVNYLGKALRDLAAGNEVATPRTKPYGCSVKYAG